MERIQSVGRYFRLLFQCVFVLIPVVYALAWWRAPQPFVFLDHFFTITTVPHGMPVHYDFSAGHKLLGFLVSLLPMFFSMLVCYFLIRLFKLYQTGVIFSAKNCQLIRNIGLALLCSQIAHLIYDALLSLVITLSNPLVQDRMIQISANSLNLMVILLALLIILIAWIMHQAVQLAEQQQLTI